MQNAERKWFEAELKGNPGLQKELELRRRVNKHVDNQEAIAFRKTLMNAEAKHRKAVTARKNSVKKNIKYAAVFAGLMVLGSTGFYLSRDNSAIDYADKYSPEYTPLTVSRSLTADMDKAYYKATDLYNSGNYTEAIKWFNMIVGEDMQIEYLKGSSHMNIQQYKEAIGSFSKVVEDNDNLFIEDAKFYLAVCYLQTGQKEKALPVLEGVISSENRHSRDAKKLLKKVD